MPKDTHTTTIARATVAHPELKTTDERLAIIQTMAVEHFATMRRIRGDESRHGLAAGMLLLTIKENLGHGEFGTWADANIVGFGKTYRAYLMKLALEFIAKMDVSRPELLAVRGDQMELAIEKREALVARFESRVAKFIGDLSLAELFEKHGIKETKKLGGARDKADATPAPEPSADQLAAQTRDEIGAAIERLEGMILHEGRLSHVISDHDFLRGVATSLGDIALKADRTIRELLAISGDPAARATLQIVSKN
jgi:hypothetical protein